MKNLKYILSLLTAFTMAVSFSGCSSDSKNGDTSTTTDIIEYDNDENSYVAPEDSEAVAKENAQVVEGAINQQASVGECSINAKKIISLGEKDSTTDIYTAEIEVTNNSADTLSVSGLSDFDVSVDGADSVGAIDPFITAVAAKTIDGFSILDTDIEAGKTATGYITFQAPKNWKEINIAFTPFVDNGSYDAVNYKITPDMIN